MGKAVSFLIFVWLMVSIGGGVYRGSSTPSAATRLTVALTDSGTTITVSTTNGFADTGFVIIGAERIGYASKTATTFKGNPAQPVLRGSRGTTAAAHPAGAVVRTLESAMLNQSIDYKIATLQDSSGAMAFLTIPTALLTLLVSFMALPLGFLGTDLQIFTYIWIALSIGVLVALWVALAGGRRV